MVTSADDQKREAAATALEYVKPGMRLGLGTGSTATWFVKLLGEQVAQGLDVVGVPTSEVTATLARSLGIKLLSLDDVAGLDLTIDGADEFDPSLNLIKGAGGALLREKIVASDSKKMIVIVDRSKKVDVLGAFPLPIEVVNFGFGATMRAIADAARKIGLAGALTRRLGKDGQVYVTDQGNWIIDASFRQIPHPEELANVLAGIPGVVEHGLFINLATTILVAGEGGVERIERA